MVNKITRSKGYLHKQAEFCSFCLPHKDNLYYSAANLPQLHPNRIAERVRTKCNFQHTIEEIWLILDRNILFLVTDSKLVCLS